MAEQCKRCLLRESEQEDIYESIKIRIEKLSEKEKADDILYKERISKCLDCENLLSGVCMKCGCYAEFRAAFKKQSCPLPFSAKKW